MTADERYAEAAEDSCEYCGRKPITGLEVAVIFGYTALVIALWEIGGLVWREVTG